MSGNRILSDHPGTHLQSGLRLSMGWLLLLIVLMMASSVVHAAEVRITWNRVNDNRVAYYEVHYGTASRTYRWKVRSTTLSALVSDLVGGSPYFFAVRACTQDGKLCSAFSREVSNGQGLGTSPQLSVSVTPATGSVSLSDEGVMDWVHWGLTGVNGVSRKAGVSAQISALKMLGGSAERFENSARLAYRWSNGAPTASAYTQAGLRIKGLSKGFEFSVPADTLARTLTLYVGGSKAQGRIEARLSDGSAPEYKAVFGHLQTFFDRRVTLTYRAASGGKRLYLRYTQAVRGDSVTIQAATLRSGSTP